MTVEGVGGAPQHEPDEQSRRTVSSMSAYGIPQEDIAKVVGVDPKTLRKHYRDELDTATAKANAKVAESLYKKATGDGSQAVTAAIFWLKTRAQWKETVIQDHQSSDGSMSPKAPLDASKLSMDALKEIAALDGTDEG
jgi:DNA-binding XRE family transcriptional regulator